MSSLLLLALLTTPPAHSQEAPPPHDDLVALSEAERLTLVEQRLADQAQELTVLRGQLEEVRGELTDHRTALELLREQPAASAPSGSSSSHGATLVIAAGEVVEHDLAGINRDILVQGHVKGSASALNGSITVAHGGVVEGDATSFGGRVIVEPGGEVHGDRIGTGGNWGLASGLRSRSLSLLDTLYSKLVFLLTFAGAGVLMVGLFPSRVAVTAQAIERRPIRSLLIGSITGTFFLGASLLFAITFVGLPIALFLWGLLGLAWLLGFVGLCQAIGDQLPFPADYGRWVAFLTGAVLITAATALPWVGSLVVFFGSVLAVGAAFSTWFGRR